MPVQNHLHLSDTLGTAPENAPNLKWKATDRILIPSFTVEIRQSLTGVRFDYALEDVVYTDMVYDLLLHDDSETTALEKLDLLVGLAGKRLYLCDHVHAADGVDHTADVQLVRMTRMGEIPAAQLALQLFHVQIYLAKLTDANS